MFFMYPPLTLLTQPEKQFALVERHIERIRDVDLYRFSPIVIMVERNLGFESEHHEKALRNLPNCRHRIDHQAKRFGILTTEDIKYGMMTLVNTVRTHRYTQIHAHTDINLNRC